MLFSDADDFNTTAVDVTFPPDEFAIRPNRLNAPIPIFDDDVNEPREQIFVAALTVESAINPALVRNDVLNVSTCIIIDNDGKLVSVSRNFFETHFCDY